MDGDLEVVYINVVENWFNGPRLMTLQGRYIWTGKPMNSLRRFSRFMPLFTGLVVIYWSLGEHEISVTLSKSSCSVLMSSFHHWFCHSAGSNNHRTNCCNCNHAIYLHVPIHVTTGIWCDHRCHGSRWSICSWEGKYGTSRQLEPMVAMASGMH